MTAPKRLEAESLANCCQPDEFSFKTTEELQDLTEIIGQSRAVQAVHFGIGIQHEGYNLYVMGPSGMGKHSMVHQYLEQKATAREKPFDWCYVNNFEQPHKPKALQLPHGRGSQLALEMEQLVDELSALLPAAFNSEEYRSQLQTIEEDLEEQQEQAFNELEEAASKKQIKLFRSPSGFTFAPLRDNKELTPEEFEQLSEGEQVSIENIVEVLQERLQAIIQRIAKWRKATRSKVDALNRKVALAAVGHPIEELRVSYHDYPAVVSYLDAVEHDVLNNIKDFLKGEESSEGPDDPNALHRYKVNNLVLNNCKNGVPVVYLDNPSYPNLVGRAEHISQFGTLVTDFTLLKPGALHEANGGYLLVDAHKLLTQPYAWEGLKRALYANQINIEPLEKMWGLASTVSLEPEPIPLDLKIVIMGDRMLYYMLHEHDPDFGELFKVQADFEEHIERSPENNLLMARLIATIARKDNLLPFGRDAVARVIDYASRYVEDAQKLTTHMRSIADLLREADYWTRQRDNTLVESEDIHHAIEQQEHRASRVREEIHEEIQRGDLFIDSDGKTVGQVNALSVLGLGNYSFGQPSRVTATVHVGEGQVIDIEREIEMGGASHSKGVLILTAFIASRYARKQPLSLSASLVFEQNYGGVDGDSASLAELCALVSALTDTPIKQSLAITGSVNQHGQVQPIGGVNEKIEGFFQVCEARGLSGGQGVIIPASNTKNLMLHTDVVEAVRQGQFHLYEVHTADEALTLLTGLEMGEANEEGEYPEGSLNAIAYDRLHEMTLIRQHYAEQAKENEEAEEDSLAGDKKPPAKTD